MGIYNGVNKVEEKLDLLSGLISSKKEFIVKQISNTILLFVIFLIFGCLDFATLTFHGEYLLSISYWGQTITKAIAGICALNIGINLLLDNEIKKSVELTRNISRYNTLIVLKDSDFEYFVVRVFNPKVKKEAYKNHITKKIYNLNRFSRRRDRLLYSSTLPENEEKKKKNRYCIKRAELEKLRSDEYIDKNLESLNVRYKEIDPAVFELEVNGATKSVGVVVSGNVNVGRAKETASVILSMVLVSMLTTAFSIGADKQEFANNMVAFWHYCLKAVEDIGIVTWQFINGTLRARKIVSSQLTRAYAGRVVVLEQYINWREENHAKNSKAYKELNTEVIEVDAEKADKIKNLIEN